MKKQWALMVLTAVLFTVGASTCNAAQKRSHSAAAHRRAQTSELRSVDQLKEAFRNEAGKVRLVALVSPT